MKVQLFCAIGLCCVLFCLSGQNAEAKVYQWIDQDNVIHFYNEAPLWWDDEKLVYLSKQMVDKVNTLKKMGLPENSPDFETTLLGTGTVDVQKNGNDLLFSSGTTPASGPGATTGSEPSEGYQPKAFSELESLKPGQVIVDLSSRHYHSAQCRRLLRGFGTRKEYRYQLSQLRIFATAEQAEKEGFKACPVCKGGRP
ncbi:DUF4124 domain-containing protein [bacterium]|nr:DUF4124 domain-containing protein [bacterium]